MKKTLLLSAVVAFMGLTPAFAADGDLSVTVNTTTGSVAGNVWTRSESPVVTLTVSSGGAIITGDADAGDNLKLNTAGTVRTVTLASSDPAYYVSAYSMMVSGGSVADVVTFTAGGTSVVTDSSDKQFAVTGIEEGTAASFTITPGTDGHAKKAICKEFTVTLSPAAGTGVTYTKITRNATWTCTADTEEPAEGNGQGLAANIVDEDASTFWHSKWSGSKPQCPHYFIVDLGQSESFDACEFVTRNHSVVNGIPRDIDVYVSENDDFSTVTVDNATSYGTPVMSTTLTLGIGASERIDFPATQTGRYILVVIKTSKNLANGGGTEADNIYGSLAEFDLYQKTGGVTPDVNVKLGRSGWTVEASSVSQDGARNPSRAIDDDTSTFWGSSWQSPTNGFPQTFHIDLGSKAAVSGFTYMPRQDGNAGDRLKSWTVYVTNTPVPVTGSVVTAESNTNGSAVASYDYSDLTAAGSGELEYLSTGDEAKIMFDSPVVGRHFYLVGHSGYNSATTSSATCFTIANINVYHDTSVEVPTDVAVEEANAEVTARKNAALALLEVYKGMFMATEKEYYTNAINDVTTFDASAGTVTEADLKAKLAEVDAAFSENIALTAVNGRIIAIKSDVRYYNNPYLTNIAATGKNNTQATLSERGKWMVLRNGNTNQFRLLNLEAGAFLSSTVAEVATSMSNAALLHLVQGGVGYNLGTAFQVGDTSDGLNVDTATGNLTKWAFSGDDSDGSLWHIELIGETDLSQISTDSYYRIRSNRGAWTGSVSNTAGSLLGINTVIGHGAEPQSPQSVHLSKDGLGTIWRIETVDSEAGTVYLRNAAADYEGQEALFAIGTTSGTSRVACVKSADPVALKILYAVGSEAKEAYGSTYSGRLPYSVCVVSPDLSGNGNHKMMDIAGNGNAVLSEWSADNADFNNGSIYYLEEATDAEAVIAAYISSCGSTSDQINESIDYYGAISALWTADAVQEAKDAVAALEIPDEIPSTVKEANASGNSNTDIDTQVAAIISDLVATADGRMVQFANIERNKVDGTKGHDFMAEGSVGTQDNVLTVTDRQDIASFWIVNHVEGEGNAFTLTNYSTGRQVGNVTTGETKIPTLETDGHVFALEPQTAGGQSVIDINDRLGHSTYSFLHESNNGKYLVKWKTVTSGAGASGWSVYAFEDMTGDVAVDVAEGTVTFSHTDGLVMHAAYPENIVITLDNAPDAEEEGTETYALEQSLTISATDLTDNGDGTFGYTLPEDLAEGRYMVNVPAAFFKIGSDKVSGAVSSLITKDDTGTTGISDITVAEPAETVVFDLMGRRVNGALTPGLYIIDGVKTLVK